MTIILISKKLKINPDNVGTPMAGSLGDVGTLITLASIATFFYNYSSCLLDLKHFQNILKNFLRKNFMDPHYIYIIFHSSDTIINLLFVQKSFSKQYFKKRLDASYNLYVYKQLVWNCIKTSN